MADGSDEELKDSFVDAFAEPCRHYGGPTLAKYVCIECLTLESSYERARRRHLVPFIDWGRPWVAVAGSMFWAWGVLPEWLIVVLTSLSFLTICLMTYLLYQRRRRNALSVELQAAASTGHTGNFTGLLE